MATNEVYPGPMRFLDLNVGASTFKSGDPVKVGGFVGVCQTDSDGGAAAGYTVKPVPPNSYPVSGQAARGRYRAVNHASVALRGAHRVPVTFTAAAPQQGDSVYIKSDNTLTTTATSNTLFGYYYDDPSLVTGAGTVKVIVVLAGSAG